MEKLNSTAACVLGLLDVGPPPPARDRWSADGTMSGAELWSAAESSVAGFWSMTRSQVYREVKRLVDAGLADESGVGRFAITDPGRVAVRQWFQDFALGEPREEQLRSPVTLTVFFGHYLPKELLARVVDEHRLRYQRRLDALRTIDEAVDDQRALPASTLRRAMLYLAGAIEWTDDVRTRLSRTGPRSRA